MEITTVTGFEEAIAHIGRLAEAKMETATSSEECAFLLGNLNTAAAIAKSLCDGRHQIHITMEYDRAKKAYANMRSQREAEEKAQECHQISMDELFPKLFKALKAVFEEETQSTKKPSTTKKSTKKE